MKQYHIIFSVPDDFNPEELELNATYKDELSIASEGFVDIKDLINVSELKVKPESVVLFKFPESMMNDAERVEIAREQLQEELGCTVIGLLDSMDILVQNSAEAVDMLQKMINTINLRSSIKIVK